jgi:Ca2+-transporting ATPase
LNDRTENTPALTLYSADEANLESTPPSPLFDPEPKPDDTKSTNPVNIEQLLQQHQDPQNPFAFKTEQLSALYDPKNIELLAAYGGLEGIAKGLHSNARDGLSTDENAPFEPITLSALTDSYDNDESKHEVSNAESKEHATPPPAQHTTSDTRFGQRQAVYGSNVLPDVKAKNIFQLMWMAFNDKTLVCIFPIPGFRNLKYTLYDWKKKTSFPSPPPPLKIHLY